MKSDIEILLEEVSLAKERHPSLRFTLPGSGREVMAGKVSHYMRLTVWVNGVEGNIVLDLNDDGHAWAQEIRGLLNWADKQERTHGPSPDAG